jgi:hypothetical protein
MAQRDPLLEEPRLLQSGVVQFRFKLLDPVEHALRTAETVVKLIE